MAKRRANTRKHTPATECGNHTQPERQAVLRTGGRMRSSEARTEARLAKWKAGAAAIEAEYAKARAVKHRFVPMGKLPSCEVCAATEHQLHDNGQRVHFYDGSK